jgi:hypothetical protein
LNTSPHYGFPGGPYQGAHGSSGGVTLMPVLVMPNGAQPNPDGSAPFGSLSFIPVPNGVLNFPHGYAPMMSHPGPVPVPGTQGFPQPVVSAVGFGFHQDQNGSVSGSGSGSQGGSNVHSNFSWGNAGAGTNVGSNVHASAPKYAFAAGPTGGDPVNWSCSNVVPQFAVMSQSSHVVSDAFIEMKP